MTGKPVEGVEVTVSKDFDGDRIVDFVATKKTTANGEFRIAIPRGKVKYDIEIKKPVLVVGSNIIEMTFKQNSNVDRDTSGDRRSF